MQRNFRAKSGYFLLFFLAVLFMSGTALSGSQEGANWLDHPVTIRFQGETLGSVLESIAKQTGIAILYDQELANEKVSGNFKNVKASEAITRLFGSKNKSIQVGKDKKIIIVRTFGAKKFIWAGHSKGIARKDQAFAPMTLGELETLHINQYKKYKERIANENEILEGGMTRSELKAMQEQQHSNYQKRITNDEEVVEGGMTRGELRAMQERQYEANQARIADNDEMIEGEITRGELRIMQEQQHRKSIGRTSNVDEILEGGMTRSELRAMQEQQYKEYKKRRNNPSRIIE